MYSTAYLSFFNITDIYVLSKILFEFIEQANVMDDQGKQIDDIEDEPVGGILLEQLTLNNLSEHVEMSKLNKNNYVINV